MAVYRRGRVWWINYTRQGKKVRKSAKTSSRAVAVAYLQELLEEEGRLARGGQPRRKVIEILDRFQTEHLPTLKPRSAERYLTSMKMLKPQLGEVYLDQLSRRHLSEYITARRHGGATSPTIRRDLACLSSAIQLAIGWGWADSNVIRTLDRRLLKESPPRRRYLSHDEERRLIVAAPPYMKPLLIFAIETGLRREEQFSLTWEQADLDRHELKLRETKSGVPRIVPLTDRALRVLRSISRDPQVPFVFVSPRTGTRYTQIARGLYAAAKRANIKDLRWHDLRRTCGCRLIQDFRADLLQVSRWLGHTTTAMTERAYAFLRVEDLHSAIRRDTKMDTPPAPTETDPGKA